MSNGVKGGGGKGNQPGTYLVIPYYSGDEGVRPLPSSFPFWMCSSININGSPYAGQQLPVGETVELTMDAINYGSLTVPALCLFFWANPTTSFTNTSVQLIGQAPLTLATDVLGTTTPVPWTVPTGTPAHICLLAEINATADPASGTYNAASDRHYGQQNVQLASATPGGHIKIGFRMANGKATAARFRLEVTHVLINHPVFRPVIAENALLVHAEEIHLSRTLAEPIGPTLHADLVAGELLELELNARVPLDATPGSTIVLQLAQYEEDGKEPVGGLGVIVHVV